MQSLISISSQHGAAAKTAADKQEIGRLADELRIASGQPKQNG
ncbi:hypothetical protein [Paenibacillus macquariensis]|nr:hypothetical protein [Paenibacillus macquariensis]MEC0091930.1 hypothetical protein [Paenibacillus macquariensis]